MRRRARRVRRRHGHRRHAERAAARTSRRRSRRSRSSASIRSARSTTTTSRPAGSPSPSATRSRASARTSSRRTMNLKILDEIVQVDDKECFLMTRDLVRLEGLFVGGSGRRRGARGHQVREGSASRRPTPAGPACPTAASKYISKIFNDDWMRQNGFLDEEKGLGTVRDLLAGKPQAAGGASTPRLEREGRRGDRDPEEARDQPAPGARGRRSCAGWFTRSTVAAPRVREQGARLDASPTSWRATTRP